ncbi:MAG: hypothetical protein IPH62_09635 [Ignavibacteriae bacterium]|nr:hypothetical protein [Ignavibacteriota bacterium]
MIISKYENISNSLPKIGYDIILKLQDRPFEPFELYSTLERRVGINKFFDILTFLYMTEIIYYDSYQLRLVHEIN